MTTNGYAVIPDHRPTTPSAIFSHLEDAIAWALETYGSDRFRIRMISYVSPPRDDNPRN